MLFRYVEKEYLCAMDRKPELLLPAGNVEAFYAAIEGGADAIYLGLKAFNARARAMNFSNHQLLTLLKEAHKNNVKIYVTLNTVIKNIELPELLQQLHFLSIARPDAVIIQDWGVAYMAKRYFPSLTIHASTQMGNHNSAGANHAAKNGFERVILARELTMHELELISGRTATELELFVHGALCYSFSGMCLFSSFLGGSGANRGLCAQPCRRLYDTGKANAYFFSLKDNQQAQNMAKLSELGIASLKIEGRMKSGSYVNNVAKAYRMTLDDPSKTSLALELLQSDLGREKTGYFLTGKVTDAITDYPNTGKLLGVVTKSDGQTIVFRNDEVFEEKTRLFIRIKNADEQISLKVKGTPIFDHGATTINADARVPKGSLVFLASTKAIHFPSKLPEGNERLPQPLNRGKEQQIIREIKKTQPRKAKEEVFLRINELAWLRKIRLEYIDGIVLNFNKNDREEFNPESPFLKTAAHKIWIELPKFIPETGKEEIEDYCRKMMKAGYRNFMLSHLSQQEFLPKGAKFATNENVYVYNDAAAKLVLGNGAAFWTSPHENEMENLLAGSERNAMISMYYFPELFYSRMPVNIKQDEDDIFQDGEGDKFRKRVRDGITIVIPEAPVGLFQYKEKLLQAGFSRFMIDLSWQKPSSNTLKRLMLRQKNAQQVQPSTTFNFKKGLK